MSVIYITKQVASACGVSSQALRKWIYDGKVADVELKDQWGRRIFTQAEMDRFTTYARSRKKRN